MKLWKKEKKNQPRPSDADLEIQIGSVFSIRGKSLATWKLLGLMYSTTFFFIIVHKINNSSIMQTVSIKAHWPLYVFKHLSIHLEEHATFLKKGMNEYNCLNPKMLTVLDYMLFLEYTTPCICAFFPAWIGCSQWPTSQRNELLNSDCCFIQCTVNRRLRRRRGGAYAYGPLLLDTRFDSSCPLAARAVALDLLSPLPAPFGVHAHAGPGT